jgi:His/Glu/Gln/Arg/opine family amino acid ABC transporter permease subunit
MEQLSPRAGGRPPGAATGVSTVNPLVSAAVPVAILLALALWLAVDVKWSFVQDLDFSVIYQYRIALLQGLLNTVLITFSSLLLGLVLGFVFACLGYAPIAPVRWLIAAYIEVLRDVPLVVALFWIHFALPVVTGISTSVFESSFIAMALQSSAYLADVVRAGIQAIPTGQWDAADALGLSRSRKWLDVVLPQSFRIIIPPLANIALGYFKASSVLALLSVGELTTVATRISNYTFKPIETFTVVAIIYLGLGYLLSALTFRLERVLKAEKT